MYSGDLVDVAYFLLTTRGQRGVGYPERRQHLIDHPRVWLDPRPSQIRLQRRCLVYRRRLGHAAQHDPGKDWVAQPWQKTVHGVGHIA